MKTKTKVKATKKDAVKVEEPEKMDVEDSPKSKDELDLLTVEGNFV